MSRFLFAVINFLLLIAIIYFVGRKMISDIFNGRLEKINKALDDIEKPLETQEESDPVKPIIERHNAALDEEIAAREAKLNELKEKYEIELENIRRESLLKSRANLIQLTMDKAREYMKSESFMESMRAQEDKVADRILSLIKLTPGDMMYLEKKARLYVSLFSSYPLKYETIGRIHQATDKLLEEVKLADGEHKRRITTGMLNDILSDAVAKQQPPSDKGKRLKLYYGTQASTEPPTFVLFCNSKDLFHYSYLRFIENQLRQAFGFSGTPIRFILREKGEKGEI